MERDFYTSPKAGRIMRALWKAAGADRYILERGTYTDHVKYACLGGIVLATGFMAAMAGGYAFYVIFEPRGEAITASVDALQNNVSADPIHLQTSIMAIVFGFIWGLIIFNIDRFIVASTGKGDGTEAITWDEIKGAIPRIIMGIIIAITISKPVEIRMFKTEIDVRIHEAQLKEYANQEKLANKIYQPPIAEIDAQIKGVKNELRVKQNEYEIAKVKFEGEMTAKGGSGIEGYGPRAKKFETEKDRILLELNEMKEESKSEINELKAQRSEAKNKLNLEKSKSQESANSLNGLLKRIQFAHEEAGTSITVFITLLFMAIELTPIFFKMMLIKSPYDFLSDNIKSLIKAEQGIEIKYDFYKDAEGIQRDLVINHQAERLLREKIKLIQTQTELSELAMESWKLKETKNIKDNPDSYVDKKS
tara:strand:- start:1054 stop:2316 length:1263 start_codon:yes stop_codon:yes gene_type:complete